VVTKLYGRSGCDDARERYGDKKKYYREYNRIFGKRKIKTWRPSDEEKETGNDGRRKKEKRGS
jgi:hypothetical protein